MQIWLTLFDRVDARITGWMARYGVWLLRLSLGVVFFWFGVLKFFAGLSPAADLAVKTMNILTFGLIPPGTSIVALAAWECAIGLGLIFGAFMRVTLLLLFVQMLGTLTPIILFPNEVFTRIPYAPNLEGQYIIKNLVLISAGLVVGATVRGGAIVADPSNRSTGPVLIRNHGGKIVTSRQLAIGLAATTLLLAGWYLFRPERAFINRTVSEAPPAPAGAGAAGSSVVLAGQFQPRTHKGQGTAQVLDLGGGRRVLRFSNFETLDGPDLQVYLLTSATVSNGAELERSGFVSLGALKGNRGDQNYEILPGTDLGRYQAVSVWCRRFAVNFTSATLAPVPATGS